MPEQATSRAAFRENWPFLVMVELLLGIGFVSAVRADASLTEPTRLVLFTLLVVATGALYWLGAPLLERSGRRLWYLLVMGAMTFAIGLMTPHHWLVLGLYPALLGLAIGMFWSDVRATGAAAAFCLVLLVGNLMIGRGPRESLVQLPWVLFSLVFVFVYVVLFTRQVEARARAQALLNDLESAHRRLREYADQVESLTLTRERERMGRELHDTLAQGLAGLIMQLEAIDGHLAGGAADRARAVVRQAMERSRATLHEARRAIQALRASALDHADLVEAIRREAAAFEASTGTPCSCEVSGEVPEVAPETAQDVLRIVQECLTNAARHAGARRVSVRMEERRGEVRVVVADDGVGFATERGQAGFGLAGMRERAARLGGTLRVESAPGAGTTVELAFRETRP